MAKKGTTPRLELVKVQEALKGGNVYEGLNIKTRSGGASMKEGIPVRVMGNTITFLEATEFNNYLAEILEKQEFPLAHGYMWLEKAKLEAFITSNKSFTINKNDVTFSKDSDYIKSGSGPGLKMGSKIDLDNLKDALYSTNPLLEKLSRLKNDKNNPPILSDTNIENQSEIFFKNFLVLNRVSATKDKSKDFYIFHYSNEILRIATVTIKKTSDIIKDINDFVIENINLEEEQVVLVALEVEPKFGSQAGHVKAVQTRSLEEHIEYLDSLIDIGEDSIDIERELVTADWDKIKTRASIPGINLKSTGIGSYQIDKTTILYLKELKKRALKVYDDLKILDRIFLSAAANLSPDVDNIIKQAQILLTAMGGTGEAIFVKTVKDGKLDLELMKIEIAYAIEALIPESPFNNKKGGIAFKVANSYATAMKNLAQAIKSSLQDPVQTQKLLTETYSSSLIEIQLLLSLDKIFNTKKFSSLIDKRKKVKASEVLLNRKRSKNKVSFPKFVLKAAKFSRVRKSRLRKKTIGSQQTESIVPLINAELKRYVLEQMTYPSLENRSGRFAGSVRVLSAQENAAVQYTYQKSPYQVFSPAKGRRPWATEERDPAKIIDRAIKKLGQDRFQKVFRTEER